MFKSDTPSGANWHHILGHKISNGISNILRPPGVRSSCGISLSAARLLVEVEDSPVDFFFVAQTWHKRVDELLLNELAYL